MNSSISWFSFLRPYQQDRILTFRDPENDPLGAGWNIIQSKIAIGSGGFTGQGWGKGTQSHLNYVPEHTTDFIFAVLAEEFGWVGVATVLALYGFVIGRCLGSPPRRETRTRASSPARSGWRCSCTWW